MHAPAVSAPIGSAQFEVPDCQGYFGSYGGQFVPETLRPALLELEDAYDRARQDPVPSSPNWTRHCRPSLAGPRPSTGPGRSRSMSGASVYLKREDLNHTGAHKINNTLGQILLARRMGKTRVIAETGAGQHGVATAAAAARLGMRCEVHMGEEDIRRQRMNVQRMELMGARVIPARCGSRTLKDATNEAIRDWVAHVEDTYYLIGSVVGPHPYPAHGPGLPVPVIGRETKVQCREAFGGLPDAVVACVGGGSNAMGMFHPLPRGRGRPARRRRGRRARGWTAATPRPSPRESPACCTAP